MTLPATAAPVEYLDLDGRWEFSVVGKEEWHPAEVPGCVHTDLLASKLIPDPLYRDNERQVQWIGETDWVFRRTFEVPPGLLERKHVILRCEGLDTLATVKINDKDAGRADNMFRTWEFPVKDLLQAGANTIRIRFDAIPERARKREEDRQLAYGKFPGGGYFRKMACNFGWDFGPTVVTCGVWRPIRLVAFDHARLDDVQIGQDHGAKGSVGLEIKTTATPRSASAPMTLRVTVEDPDGKAVASGEKALDVVGNAAAALRVEIPNPRLWWPAGMGEHPLYRVRTDLLDQAGTVIDTRSQRIGLRKLAVRLPSHGVARHFEINGVPFFAKGANMIPADPFPNRVTSETRRRLVRDAVDVNMNMLRIWGGGYYPEDEFFDFCDEAGLLTQVDFAFACGRYPAFDRGFLENVRCEARDQVKRLRNHPSLAIWCGNNEVIRNDGSEKWIKMLMGETDYNTLFLEILGDTVALHAPENAYVFGSPGEGDDHNWSVWHGDRPFEWFRQLKGFYSEFGFQSYPEPRSMETVTAPEDRADLRSPVMYHRQRSGRMYLDRKEPEKEKSGVERIETASRHYFGQASGFDDALRLSQITQAHGIEMAVRFWRTTMPRTMGTLFWQYNDMWVGPTWSSVDALGRWKALHFRTRKFFDPLVVTGLTCDDNGNPFEEAGRVAAWITSDRLTEQSGTLRWRATRPDGKELNAGSMPVKIPANASHLAKDLNMAKEIASAGGPSNVLLWLTLEIPGREPSEDLVVFSQPGDVPLADPGLAVKVTSGSGTVWNAEVSAAKPALWTWVAIEGDGLPEARFSDNFFHLQSGEKKPLTIRLSTPASRESLAKAIRVRSLQGIERTPTVPGLKMPAQKTPGKGIGDL